nr:hypothetical protein [Dialister succinatiphilus]
MSNSSVATNNATIAYGDTRQYSTELTNPNVIPNDYGLSLC